MRHNEQKNPPHSDPPLSGIPALGLAHILRDDGSLVPHDEFIENCARLIAQNYKKSKFDDDLKWIRQKENRKVAVKVLKNAHRILQRLAPLLRDDRDNPTIFVKEFRKPHAIEMQLKALDYFAGHFSNGTAAPLKWIAHRLDTAVSPAGACPKFKIKEAAEDLEQFFRDNCGRPCHEKIGRILLEVFPKAQGTRAGDLADWVRQLVKPRSKNGKRSSRRSA
jgi:hypothetical protein